MSAPTAITLIIITVIGASYGWGMRGTTIGGEKGAMLPGAIIGLLIATLSGVPALSENYIFFTALGALGMFFGGCMTYGQTLDLSMGSRPAKKMKKGLTALFVKGFLWFGVFGAVLSVGLAVLSGEYFTPKEVLLIFAMMPICMVVFFFIFNRPFNPHKKVFPKIYFSYTRSESWGAMLGLLVELLLIAIIKKITFAVEYTLLCAVFGAVGWVVAQLMQVYCRRYSSTSKNKLMQAWGSARVDAWKVMECVLGAFGGLGAALGIVLFYKDFSEIASKVGNWDPLRNFDEVTVYVYIALLVADMVLYFIPNDKIKKYAEYAETPLYAGLPLALVFLGGKQTATLVSFFVIYWVIIQEVFFDKKKRPGQGLFPVVCGVAVGALLIFAQLYYGYTYSPIQLMLMYGVFYEVFTLAFVILPSKGEVRTRSGENGKSIVKYVLNTSIGTVHGYFLICIAVVTVWFAIISRSSF